MQQPVPIKYPVNELDHLGLKYKTDKASNHHNYLGIYASHLDKFRGKEFVLIDAVGGYEYPDRGGESLRMWAEYFPQARIVGIDLHYKELSMPANVHLYKCNQTSKTGLEKIIAREGLPMVFIDDFSHFNRETIRTFEIIWPMMKSGGVYIVEDIEGSWYPDHGFGGTRDAWDLHFPSSVNHFRALTNALNKKFIPEDQHAAIKAFDDILGIFFYTNCIIIQKK